MNAIAQALYLALKLLVQVVHQGIDTQKRLDRIEKGIADMTADQSHLDTDVQGLSDAITLDRTELEQVITDLKNQPGGAGLDFTKADALLASEQAQASADAPVTPPAPSA
jgi:hypothetical protein